MDPVKYFQSHESELIQWLEALVKLESPTSDKEAVDRCSHAVLNEFRKLNVEVTTYPQKNTGDLFSLIWPGDRADSHQRANLILLHVDTVWPIGTILHRPCKRSGNRLYGPGALDMKAGVVMTRFALARLQESGISPERPVKIFISSCEETGSRAADEIIRKLSESASGVFCLEPSLSNGRLKLERKGRSVVRLSTRGRSAHAGSPEKGVNAIDELIFQLGQLYSIRSSEVTVNAGRIKGGENINTVAARAWIELDIRYPDKKHERDLDLYLGRLTPHIKGAAVEYSVLKRSLPMVLTPPSQALFERVKALASPLGLKLFPGKTGGGSDAVIPANMNIPTLDGLGPEGGGIHAEDEHILIPSLIERTALLTAILTKI